MSLPTLVLHVVPIQVNLAGTTATITCNDPRAKPVGDEIVFELAPLTDGPPNAQQRVAFVVEDPPDTSLYDNYLNMSSAPPLERLIAWKRTGTTSRSPDMLPGFDFEVVAVVFGVPRPTSQPSPAVQMATGRVRFKIRGPGLPGGF